VGIIRGPHEVVHADHVAIGDADRIVHKRGADLPLEVLAGFQLEGTVDHLAVALKGMVHAPDKMIDPADVVFRGDELQVREPIQHPREDQGRLAGQKRSAAQQA